MGQCDRVILELSPEQAAIVERAVELFFRIHIGQFDEIKWVLFSRDRESISENTEAINSALKITQSLFFPTLRQGESFNVNCCDDCNIAYNVYQAIRYVNAWHRNPDGGIGVNFDPPLPNGMPIPKCYIKKEGAADEANG